MHRFSAALIAAVSTIAFTQIALAADLARKAPAYTPPPAPIYSWTGFYVGGNAGYDWNDVNVNSNFSCPAGGGCSVTVPANVANIIAASSGSIRAHGFTGGGQAGYNWQVNSAVLSVETDFNAFNLNGSRSAAVPSVSTTSIFNPSTSVHTDWLFTLRGRLGWTVVPTVLLYGTGGLAVTEARISNTYTTTNNPLNTASGASSSSNTRAGWTIGGGAEWAFDPHWSVKAEYLYADFGSISTSTNVASAAFVNANIFSTSVNLKANIIRAGVNYKF
jgi:outer membrane immunogenic protein